MPHRGEQALLVIVWAMLYRVLRVSARLHFSNEQMETINQMDRFFRKFQGETFFKGRGVITQLINEIESSFPTLNKKAIRLFCRLRTCIRIRHLNRNAALVSSHKAQQKNKKWIKSIKINGK